LIGGSADSSKKIVEIVQDINLERLTLIIVQHVHSDHVGIFDKLLREHTNYEISYAQDKQLIKKEHIYLARRDYHLEVINGRFHLNSTQKYNNARPSISISYESFSNYYKEKLLVIQECGYANDGVDKLEVLKKNTSKIIIQKVQECEAKSMPQKALHVELHDYSLDLKNITYLMYFLNIYNEEKLLQYLKQIIVEKYAYDFRLYSPDMFKRRLRIFMLKHDIKSMKNAVGIILFNRSAFKDLFLEVSINVTDFFRNPESFLDMKKLLSISCKNTKNLKIWSAGCSSGEEPYSLAILLDMIGFLDKSIIYATDFNDVILKEAKSAIYPMKKYNEAKKSFLQLEIDKNFDDYIEKYDDFIIINEKIRKKVLFFQHNLVSDSSFNEFDIIICKNVMIYFSDDLQEKVFELFYKSLRYGGYLILGESENLSLKYVDKFKEYSHNLKIFKKVA